MYKRIGYLESMRNEGYTEKDLSRMYKYEKEGVPEEAINEYLRYVTASRGSKTEERKEEFDDIPYRLKLFRTYKRYPIMNSFYLHNIVVLMFILISILF